jgi:ubiquinone/menaquinone biosynthesis C-methylase UbiE
MDSNEENLNSWNKVAEMYETHFMDLDIYNDSYQTFCNLFTETNPRILDIGCGPGNITKQLLQFLPTADLMGIDMAENMIELAKKNVPSAYFEVMDCRTLDHYHGEFEGVVAGFCIPYLNADETAKLFADVYDVLTEDGLFYISFVAGDPSNSGFITGSTGDRMFFNYHTEEALKNTLLETGFQLLHTAEISYTKRDASTELHTVFIARKLS